MSVDSQVFGQRIDTSGQYSYLHVRRPGVAFVLLVTLYNRLFFFFA